MQVSLIKTIPSFDIHASRVDSPQVMPLLDLPEQSSVAPMIVSPAQLLQNMPTDINKAQEA